MNEIFVLVRLGYQGLNVDLIKASNNKSKIVDYINENYKSAIYDSDRKIWFEDAGKRDLFYIERCELL